MREKFVMSNGAVGRHVVPADLKPTELVWATRRGGSVFHGVGLTWGRLRPLCGNAQRASQWIVAPRAPVDTQARADGGSTCGTCLAMAQKGAFRNVTRRFHDELEEYEATLDDFDEDEDDEDHRLDRLYGRDDDEEAQADLDAFEADLAAIANHVRNVLTVPDRIPDKLPDKLLLPFIPATRPAAVFCVACGAHDHAETKITEYPTRYLPHRWTVDSANSAVRCGACSQKPERRQSYDFWLTHAVLVAADGSATVTPRALHPDPHLTLLERLDKIAALLEKEAPMPESKNEVPVSEAAAAPTLKSKAAGQLRDLGGAVMGAGQMILVNQSGEILLRMARKVAAKGGPLGEMLAPLLEDEDGREVAKLAMALMLHSVGTYAPLPKGGDALRKIGHIQTQTSAFVLGNKYIGIIMAEMGELMALGDQLSDALDTGPAQLPRENGTAARSVFENAGAQVPEGA